MHDSVGVTHLQGAPRHTPVLKPFRLPETAPQLSLPALPATSPDSTACPLCVTWRSASATCRLNAAAVSEARPECRPGQPSAFTAEEASEGSAAPSVRTPVHCGVVCGTCSSPVQRPPGGTPSWGQEVGPAPKTAQKKCADSWQGARGGAGGQSVTRRRLARVTGVVSDGTTRGLVLRAAKGSDAPGAGRSEGPDQIGEAVLAKLTGRDS